MYHGIRAIDEVKPFRLRRVDIGRRSFNSGDPEAFNVKPSPDVSCGTTRYNRGRLPALNWRRVIAVEDPPPRDDHRQCPQLRCYRTWRTMSPVLCFATEFYLLLRARSHVVYGKRDEVHY